MASASADTCFARPVYLPKDRGKIQMDASPDIPEGCRKDAIKRIRFADVENVATHEYCNIDNSSPPPRPPPPRSICATKYSEYALSHKDKQKEEILINHKNDELRRRDNTDVSTGTRVKLRDLPSITTQTMAATLHNYSTVGITECISDPTEPTVDTSIAMTTEEERGNQENINHSLDKYISIKNKSDRKDMNKSKVILQNKTNSNVQFSDFYTFDTNYLQIQNGAKKEQLNSKVVPLHIRTENRNGHSWMSSVHPLVTTNSDQGSPTDSPDDGYGTNSSTGTVSSPFSSSFGSTDLDCSINGSSKRIVLSNGAIKSNSVRESWAVKRKQRLIETQDNNVQEQLRELNIIEEEENVTRNTNSLQDNNCPEDGMADKTYTRIHGDSIDHNSKCIHTSNEGSRGNLNYEVPFITVSPNDLQRINTQLYVMDGGTVTNGVRQVGNVEIVQANRRVDCNGIVQPLSTNENESIEQNTNNGSENNLYQTGNRIERNVRAGSRIRTERSLKAERSLRAESGSRPEGNTRTELASWDNGHEISGQNGAIRGNLLPQTRNEQYSCRTSDSGNTYINSSDNETLHSLNESNGSTSSSSSSSNLQEIIELTKIRGGILGTNASNVPASPLEELRGDLLEKWSDMDRNYRNYYGFDDQGDRYSRTDSKVNYFQEKKINITYGHDNYYYPHTYGADTHTGSQASSQRITRDSTDGHTPNQEETSSSHVDSKRSTDLEKDTGVKSILFKMLPTMFKRSSMKHSTKTEDKKDNKNIKKADRAFVELPHEAKCDSYFEAERINPGDLPQYSLDNVGCEEKLKKGQFVSLDHLPRTPAFASSKEINKLFSNHSKALASLSGPGRQRHSFHAMPLSYRHNVRPSSICSDTRQRTASINVSSTRGQEIRNSVENLTAMLALKNAAVMNHVRQFQSNADVTGSTLAGTMVQATSRTRLNSNNSGEEAKLSTLV